MPRTSKLGDSSNQKPDARRVLHLVHSSERRGAEVFATQLARSMQEFGPFENALCSLFQGRDALPDMDLPVWQLDTREEFLDARFGLDLLLLYRLSAVVRKFRPDVIMAHGSGALKYAALARVIRRNTATVYRNIGTASFWARSSAKARFNRLLLKGIDRVVSVSQATKEDFTSLYGLAPERVTYIPNGVDASQFDGGVRETARNRVRRELGLTQTGTVWITVGSLTTEKGHGDLLKIVASLRDNGVDGDLIIVGDGPLRGELEPQAEQLGIAERVHFLGTREDVPQILAAADIFVLPSRSEGMPAVLIEAGLAGLPTVAYDVGGVAEVVEHGGTGVVVPAGDCQGLFEAIKSLSRDPAKCTAMGEAAKGRCRELFDIKKVARQYEELFQDLICQKSGDAAKARKATIIERIT